MVLADAEPEGLLAKPEDASGAWLDHAADPEDWGNRVDPPADPGFLQFRHGVFRPFDRGDLLIEGKVKLFDAAFVNDEIRKWTQIARRLLGLPQRDDGYRNHVSQMICWNRETVKAMQNRIETSTGMNWQIALARTLRFSEYITYGVFVREALGYKAVDHAPSRAELVKVSWQSKLTTDADIDVFFNNFDPQTVAVMVHSKDGIDPTRYRHHLERLWRAAG